MFDHRFGVISPRSLRVCAIPIDLLIQFMSALTLTYLSLLGFLSLLVCSVCLYAVVVGAAREVGCAVKVIFPSLPLCYYASA